MAEREDADDGFGGDEPEEISALSARLAEADASVLEGRARALRAGLADFDLDEEDRGLLDDSTGGGDAGSNALEDTAPPVLAVIGRPNVGKSTLVNRILGRRAAVVEDTPGVTRDRVSYPTEWVGREFTLVDTGGWDSRAAGIGASVTEQAERAIAEADAVLFVVDATVGATGPDEQIVRILRRSGKPVVLVANKVDDQRAEAEVSALWALGMGEPHPVSALHGRGAADMLDAALAVLPAHSAVARPAPGGPRRVALVGRPNVGKSSLLNQATGKSRVVVDDVAGTTRDPVDEVVVIAGRAWQFIDTAGIRKRVHLQQGSDYYATLRTAAAVDRSEVAVVLFDVTEPISEQDVRIVDMVLESGRALVLAFNKWDLLDDDRRRYLEREIEQDLGHVAWAPRVNLSAATGRHLEKLVPALEAALEGWDTRIPTAKFNAFLQELLQAHPHPLRGGKQPRILFGTQASTRPPRFVLFTTGFLDPGYRRYIVRRLREVYGFVGTPIEVSMRVRERRRRS